MAIIGAIGAFVTLLFFAFRETEEIEIPAAEVARADRAYQTGAAG
jgi:hypothetical protein